MAQGRYTYTLDVENSRALKKLADFARASDKATQRIEKDIRSQKKANASLGSELLKLKRKYAEAQQSATKFGKHDDNRQHLESLRRIKEQIGKVREEYAKGRRELVKFNLEQRKGATQYSSPMGPAAPRRGFGGNTGRRAGFARGVAGRFGSTGMGSAMAGGAAAAAGGLATAGAVVALAALTKGMIAYGNQAAIAAAQQAKFQRALVGVLGDDTKQGLEAINNVVKTYNVPLASATENFTRLAASTRSAGVSTEDAKKVFEGMIVANKALGGSNEQLNGILLATQQVFSKGKVTAEELRGQIGERLPGAVSLFAKSMGITTAELDEALEKGTVSVEDFVKFSKELFEEFGDTAKEISKGPEEAGARLSTALNELQLNVGKMLGPVGAMFQNVFTEIIKLVNQATLALMRFYNIGLDNQLNAAIQARVRAENQLALLGDRDQINLGGGMGQSRILTREQAEANVASTTKAAAELQKRFNEKLGVGQSGMDVGSLLTTEDMLKNRGKRGGKNSADAEARARANAARALARVQKQEVEKVAALERKLITETFNHRLSLTQQQFVGETAAQMGILNTYIQQNRVLEERAKKFLTAVEDAKAELAIAETRLAASPGGSDAIKAQGAVDIARAKLSGAESQRDTFAEAAPGLAGANTLNARFAATAPFRETTKNAQQEIQALKTRNRLIMEGFSGAALEGAIRKNELDQVMLDKLTGINEAKAQGLINDAFATEQINSITEANINAKAAVDALTESQLSQNSALADYVVQAQEYITNVQERMVEIAQTIEQSIADAVMGLVNGTLTATEAFHNFFKSVGEAFIKMAAQMIAKLIVINLLKGALGMIGGGAPAAGAAMSTTQYFDPMTGLGVAGPNFGFADGGIVTKPTNALIGEGGMNEAVVPLPNGRSIPVDMKGGAGGAITSNVTVNVTNEGDGGNSDPEGPAKLGKAIDTAVRKVIMDERRSGGLLYSGR